MSYAIPFAQLGKNELATAGGKGANLGELKHHFPEAVTEGPVIPFGPVIGRTVTRRIDRSPPLTRRLSSSTSSIARA